MAVIREKQQFRNQRIGVVKMDTGAENYYNTVANAADNLTQIAFKEAGRQAEEKGKETAEAVKTQALRTINPETGKPEAYNIPEKFGTVAQASYEEVLDRRFINDVDQQIKDRGRDLFLKYQNDPHGVEKYSQSMEDYVAQMIEPKNNAGILNDRFKNIIKDTGAAFIASTKFNLMSKRAAIVADQLRAGLDQDAINASEEIVSVIQTVDPLDYEGGEVTRTSQLIADLAIAEMDAGLESGILTVPQHKANVQLILKALPEGMLTKRMNYNSSYVDDNNVTKQMNSDVGILIESAIDTGVIPDNLPKSLVPQVQELLDSDGYKENKKSIQQKVGDLRLGLERREAEVKKKTQRQINRENVVDKNYVVDSTDNGIKDAVDFHIARQIDGMDPENPNMVPYFSSEESTKEDAVWKFFLVKKNVISTGMELSLKRLARLEPMKSQEMKTLLSHYNYLSKVNIGGSIVNKTLDSTLSKEDNAFLRTLNAITIVGGAEDIVPFAAKLKENMQNTPLVNNTIKSVFDAEDDVSAKEVLTSYLQEEFGTDYEMIETVRPYVKHLIMSGVKKDDLDNHINEMFETSYIETDGVVVDRYNSNSTKSMFAIKRILPDNAERQTFYRNTTELVQQLSGENFVLDDRYFGIDRNRQIKLVPTTASAFQPDSLPLEYKLEDDLSEEGFVTRNSELKTFQYIAYYVADDGQLRMIPNKTGGPILIGTELAYDDIFNIRKEKAQDEIYDSNTKTLRRIEINRVTKARINKNIKALSNIKSPFKDKN